MHICFITSEYPKQNHPHGGVGTFVYSISKALVAKGYRISVIGINVYNNSNETIDDEGVSVFRLAPRIIKGLTWYLNYQSINKKIKDLHEDYPIDIIETAELGLAFIRKIKNVKYVIRLHGGHHFFAEAENRGISKWKGFQERRSFKKADAFIAVSKYVKNHTSKYLSYHNKLITVIRYPINTNIFTPMPDVIVESNTILFAGTVCEKKGIDQLLRAMPRIIKSNPNVKLKIYGRDWFFPDGSSYITYLKEQLIPTLGKLENKVEFMGVIPLQELAKKYASAEVCVFPSKMETQGLVAPEAMAMNKIVIFSNVGPGPETINHKKTGLLCNPYDENDIADNILWALNNKENVKSIAKKGKEFVLNTFGINTILNDNIKFYKSIK
jgi:glycosyltransferase involved in cell wall biosynthesis